MSNINKNSYLTVVYLVHLEFVHLSYYMYCWIVLQTNNGRIVIFKNLVEESWK